MNQVMKKLLFFLKKRGKECFLLLLTIFCYQMVWGQQFAVRGIVKDVSGPMPGVSVKVIGSSTGAITDANGAFRVRAAKNAKISFTFVGYRTQIVDLQTRTISGTGDYILNVTLLPEENSLEEVVVVGFGTQKKVNLTGAVGTVDSKALADRPVQNATQALQGLVTGLNISQNNGSLESTASINIRGTGTIGTSSSSPLILIDGMEGSINTINPQDIENISVLKDAAASAVYGSRAAFGVILVTTKKGKSGKLQVNYNDNFRQTAPVLLPKMMDSYTFALYFNDAGINGGSAPHFNAERLQRIKDYQDGKITTTIIPNTATGKWADGYDDGNANVDWYKAMYRDHDFSQEHNVSLTGGSDKTKVYLSGNYLDQNGMMKFNRDFYNRYSVTAKINTEIAPQLSLNFSTRFLREDYQRPADLTDAFYSDLGRQGWPTLPLYDPNGFLFGAPSPALNMAEGGKDKSQKDWLYQQIQLVFEPIKGWRTFGEINYRTRDDFRHWDSQATYNHDINGNPYPYRSSSNVYEYGYKEGYFNTNIYSEYSKTVAQKHNFKIMGGFQSELTKYHDVSAQKNGIIVPSIPTLNTTSGIGSDGKVVAPSVSGQYQNWAIAGFFGRLNYDYAGRYLLEGNLRYDGSSRFRGDKRWNLFPSISGGWNIARENFWKNYVSVVNTLKVRASYGELGNQNTNDWYPTYVVMPVGSANGSWLINNAQPNTASAPGLVSSTLTWETIKSRDVGFDIGLLNNRLTGSFDWFNRKTLNMVGPAPELPVTLGTSVPQTNNTDLKTQGFELELAWTDRLKNGLGYNARFILSDYQTTVTRYPNATGSLSTYRAGQKLGEIWGYSTVGIAKTQEEMDAHLATLSNGQSTVGTSWAAGDIMYEDYNKDGKFDAGSSTESDSGDWHKIGNSTPRYSFGIDLSADWKGFDFRTFFQGVIKRDYWQGSYFFWGATNNIWWSTGMVYHEDYFRNDPDHPLGLNLDSFYPRPVFGTSKNQQVQSKYLLNAAYIRLKNIQLGYTLPVQLTRKFGCQRLRAYISGENVWTGTKMAKMFDPETVDGGSSGNGNVYPLSKVWSLGVSVTF